MVSAEVVVQNVQMNAENHYLLLGVLLINLLISFFFIISDEKGKMNKIFKLMSPKRICTFLQFPWVFPFKCICLLVKRRGCQGMMCMSQEINCLLSTRTLGFQSHSPFTITMD